MRISAVTRRDPFLAAVQDAPAQQQRLCTIVYCTACWITWNDFLFFRSKSKAAATLGGLMGQALQHIPLLDTELRGSAN